MASKNPVAITQDIIISLNQETYFFWKSEVLQVIVWHGLLSYFNGTNKDEFTLWSMQEDIIVDWLYKNLPPGIISDEERPSLETTQSLWNHLERMHNAGTLPRPSKEDKTKALDNPITRSSKPHKTTASISGTLRRPSKEDKTKALNNPIPRSSKPHKTTASISANPIKITHEIICKLNAEDYEGSFCAWESEVLGVLKRLGLQDYLQENNHGSKVQEQLIRNWLVDTLPTAIICELSPEHCRSTPVIWKYLRQLHTSNYFPTVQKLKLQLETAKKGNASCAKYLDQIESIGNKLKEVGCINYLKGRTLVHYAIKGLGYEFHDFILDVMKLMLQRPLSISNPFDMMDEFHILLLKEEARLLSLAQPPIVHHPGQTGQPQCTPASQPAPPKQDPATNRASTDETGASQTHVRSGADSSPEHST